MAAAAIAPSSGRRARDERVAARVQYSMMYFPTYSTVVSLCLEQIPTNCDEPTFGNMILVVEQSMILS